MNQEDEKWACEKCTFLNWPSSQKCTICRSSKPLHILFSGSSCKSQDIYQLAPPPVDGAPSGGGLVNNLSSNNGGSLKPSSNYNNVDVVDSLSPCSNLSQSKSRSGNNNVSSLDLVAGGDFCQQQQQPAHQQQIVKWSCHACTYLNWPRAGKCVQCQTTRSKDAVKFQRKSVPPKIETNDDAVGGGRRSQHSASPPCITTNTQSPPTILPSVDKQPSSAGGGGLSGTKSPSSPDGSNVQGPSTTVLDSQIIAKKLQKWTCVGCTYENWPKTAKCVMCYSLKPGTSPARRLRSPQSPASPNRLEAAAGSGAESNDKKRSLSSGKEGGGRKSPKSSSSTESVNSSSDCSAVGVASSSSIGGIATASPSTSSGSVHQHVQQQQQQVVAQQNEETKFEKHMKKLRKQLRDVDYLWFNAVKAVVVGSGFIDCDPIEAFLAAGGDVARALTHAESQLLSCSFRGSHFETGHTLVHLAIRHHREDLLSFLLACTDQPVGGRRVKKVPCHLSPDAAADIRRQVAMSLRQRKGDTSCFFFTDIVTFCLPSAIYDLPPTIQEKLFDELLDRGVQKELEEEYSIINWSVEVTDRLGSRLFALWNRTAGDCLLDSVLQATWGVFDSENSLRQALSDSLSDAANMFYPRWREYETYLADLLHFTIDEDQFARDWDVILQLASKPGSALEQAHIFALAHIIRRPIIVYGVRIVKSFRGESIDYARFEGLYLPLLWEPSFCWRSPICLGYTRGHFSALVPMEPEAFEYAAIARVREFPQQPKHIYLPLQDADGQMLPIHFLSNMERGHEQLLLKNWLDVCLTESGLLCCKMRLHHRLPPVVQQMVEDWLDYYRRLGQMHQAASTALARSKASSSNKKTSGQTPGYGFSNPGAVGGTLPTTSSSSSSNDVVSGGGGSSGKNNVYIESLNQSDDDESESNL